MESQPVSMPSPVSPMLIPTLNKTGFMTTWIDPYTEAFLEFASIAPGRCLDIGAAYGVATLAALARGAEVIASDLDKRHLEILAEKVPESQKERLTLLPGKLPDGIDLEPASVGAILCSRVLHFLPGEVIERSIQNMFTWSQPGGKVYLIADTPYNQLFRSFWPLYESRKQAGEAWPGRMEKFATLFPDKLAESLPEFFHVLEPDILEKVVKNAGFRIEKSGFIDRLDYPAEARLDGRECVGIIAAKD
jgi:SAM-dependent methyltransferase